MSAYTTIEISPEFAKTFLVGKIMTANNEQLGDMMDMYGDEEPYCLNNFIVVDKEQDES